MKVILVSSDRTPAHGAPANLGDAFLTDALARALNGRGHSVRILDFGEGDRTFGPSRTRISGIRAAYRQIREADMVVVGGGTLFQDDRPDALIGGLPRLMAAISGAALLARRNVAFFGIGCDPVRRPVPRALLRFAAGTHPIWVRDAASLQRAEKMFSRTVALGADACLLMSDDLPHWTGNGSNRLLYALNHDDAPSLTEQIVKAVKADGLDPHFLSMDQRATCSDANAVPSNALSQLGYANAVSGWESAIATISSSRLLVASRMHALYMAALCGTPSIAVGERPKVVAFAEEFGVPRVASLREIKGVLNRATPASGRAVQDAVSRANASLDDLLALASRVA